MTDDDTLLDSPDAIRRHLAVELAVTGFMDRGLRVVLCGERNEVLLHCHVGDLPPELSESECAKALCPLAHPLGGGLAGAMLVALTRPGPLVLTAGDRRWFRVAHAVCADHEVRMLGVHLVTPHGQREVVLDDAL
jgi:hypothetical protein